jgi:hypothetical protein
LRIANGGTKHWIDLQTKKFWKGTVAKPIRGDGKMKLANEQLIIEDLMLKLGSTVDQILKDSVGNKGWAIMVFEFHIPGLSTYISNASRESMIMALRETAEKLEKNEDLGPSLPTIQ